MFREVLRGFGYSDAQIDDAAIHCSTIEEALRYIPADPTPPSKRTPFSVPDVYCIEESSSDEDDSDVEIVEVEGPRIHFRGDTLFLNELSGVNPSQPNRYVDFYRLFSTSLSKEHDQGITHILMTSFVHSESMLNLVFSKHMDAEVTFLSHLDPDEKDRKPIVQNGGLHQILFPSFPAQHGYHCFHPKLILIRFADRLRVVISSSNLFEEDWTEWSQCVWMQDFFLAPEGERGVAEKKLDLEFRTQLIGFLRACGCPDDRLFNLLRGVFFKGLRVRLVTSVPCVQTRAKMGSCGHLRLREILRSLDKYYASVHVDPCGWHDAEASRFVPVLSLCSSIGTPVKSWLLSLLRSCRGDCAVPARAELSDCLHVVFPTEQCVRDSAIGEDMAGSLIFTRRNFNAGRYSREYLKQYANVAGREGSLPHAKYLMPAPAENRPRLPWVYAGSHNCTRSAWGALEQQQQQFRVSNYECGVVLLPKNYVDWVNGDLKSEDHPKGLQEDDLCEPVDLPFAVPYKPYHSVDVPFCVDSCVCLIP